MEKIRINVTIKASSETIYNALTTEDGLSGWWAKQTTASLKSLCETGAGNPA